MMKALVFKNKLEFKEVDRPSPEDDEALIKVSMAGVCNTDLELIKGYMGFEGVLGHEFVGKVDKAGSSDWVGKRVCGEINFGCGKCNYCLSGLSRHCPNRSVMGILNRNGTFAEYVTLPIKNLIEIPDSVPDNAAVFVEPLAAALEILEQIHVEPNNRAVVVGDGKLGLLICQILKLTGCELCLVGKHPRKLEIAESWSVKTFNSPKMPDTKCDIVVEASGNPSGFSTALRLVRPRGTVVLKSTYHGNLKLDAAPIVIDEIKIIGSRCGPFAAAVRILEQNLVDVFPLIEEIYPFEQALLAFERARQKESLKILLDFNSK